ncbi:penicillin-binding transpeptidase domain-containing protein [Cellulomonas endophytica]|uniref:penicillin-binding transpeptidase domain-containing protein n=1 Tax=Cellulomonas endophytica TaxID=2494735 RepID=UPI001F0C28B6|nr:penicillin-binding transpeptidase domain-containing protein [Cellulomonas endophytica]
MGRTGTPVRRWAPGALALVLVVGGLTACTPDRPAPEDEAADLAAALTSGTFDAVALAEGATPQAAADARAAAYAGLGDRAPEVTVASVTPDPEDEDRATAALDVRWDLDAAEPWTYTVRAALVRGGDAEDPDAWQVRWSPALLAPDLVAGEELATVREPAERGDVLGDGGVVLVEDRPVQRIGIDRTLGDPATQDADARALAAALGLDPDAYAAQVAASGERAFVQAIVVREGDPAYDVGALTAATTVRAVADTLPLAPTRGFARAVLGTVGEATAEVVEASGGAVVAGDLAGLSGLQERYDAALRGTPGLAVRALSADGAAVRELFTVPAVPGADLRTTLSADLQTDAEGVLAGVEPASAIVALRASTGEVLAAASGPGSAGVSTAMLGQYAPGSTFKIATALGWLRSGATPTTTVACPPTTTVEGRTFENFPGYPAAALGDVPLRTAFAHSCNTAFIGARDAVPQAALAGAAAALGLTGQGDLGFSAFLGDVPSEATGTDHAASMIGQGRVLASPLGMATVAASVGRGERVTPRLVLDPPAAAPDGPDATDGDGGGADAADAATSAPTATGAPAAPSAPATPAAPLTAAEAGTLRELMRAVVTEGGGSALADVPGGDVAAKTGTAQFGTGPELQNHAWLVALQGDLAVAVFVEVGEFGSTTAGPLLEAFLSAAAG